MSEGKKIKVPDTAALFLIIIVLVSLLTLIVPSGQYDRMVDEATGRTLVVDGTFQWTDAGNITIPQVLTSIFRGITGGADIIAFIFVVGGAFGIINATGAFMSGLDRLMHRFSNKEEILIAIMMLAFAVCGTTFGMGEEALPFVALIVALIQKMGMDRITGVAIVVIGIYSGYTAGITNPFNTGIAQGIAELPTFSGMGLRVLLFVGAVAIGMQHTIAWGKKCKRGLNLNDGQGAALDTPEPAQQQEIAAFTGKHKTVLLILAATVVVLIFGVLKYGWYFEEMAALFTAMGFICGLVYFRSLNDTANAFIKGASEMTVAVMYLALARAILVVMQDGQIMDTVVYALSIPLAKVNGVVAAWGIYLSQGIVNFLIPSSSGQAAAVMPILSPLADIIGVSRQTCVLAYQCGDGFWNMITPTQMVVMAACGLGGVTFAEWFKFAWKLVLKWTVWTCIVLAIAVMIGYGPF